MHIANEAYLLDRQLEMLSSLLRRWPILDLIEFQGRNLGHWVSEPGTASIREAIAQQSFDSVARNHGISRLRLDDYQGEVIWDANVPKSRIIFEDDVIQTLEDGYELILLEVLHVLSQRVRFPDSDSLTNQVGLWSHVPFFSSAPNAPNFENLCPETARLLRGLQPSMNLLLGFTFVSILSGNTTIASHRGSTSLRQRYHLGLIVPEPGQAQIRIDDEWIAWEGGKAFGFNDSYSHEVINSSQLDRVALIVDLWPKEVPSDLIEVLVENAEIFDFCVLHRDKPLVAVND